MTAPLKLAALDDEDLRVLAAHVQDAVMVVGDIDWRPREKRLTLALNRFAWEANKAAGKNAENGERRRAVLHFARVGAVRSRQIRRDAPDAVLSLLTLRFEPAADAPAGAIFIEFSGGGSLALDVECIEASLADLGPAWAAASRPSHDGA